MKTDKNDAGGHQSVDRIERAHLREPGDASHTLFRYDVPVEFAGLLRRFWIPVWSLGPSEAAPQRDFSRVTGTTPGRFAAVHRR